MAMTIQLHQVTSILDGPLYRVKNEVLAAAGIDKAVFVYKTATQTFDHYALAADMELYPNTYEEAVQNSKVFYRRVSVQRDWPTTLLMRSDVEITQTRIQALLNAMAVVEGSLTIDITSTLSAGV